MFTVAWLATVDVADLTRWVQAIDLRVWPQQSQRELKPAMVTDPNWFRFAEKYTPVVTTLMGCFPGCSPYQQMLSVVMPGHFIEPHVDQQAPYWKCRVHVPLTSNVDSFFIVGGEHHSLVPGNAYQVNTKAEHSVVNNGTTPRIHFMFDVRENA